MTTLCTYCYNSYSSGGGLTRHLAFCPEKRSRDEKSRLKVLAKETLASARDSEKKIISALRAEMKETVRSELMDMVKQFNNTIKDATENRTQYTINGNLITNPVFVVNNDNSVVNNDNRVVNIISIREDCDRSLSGFKHKLLAEIDRDPEAWKTVESSRKRLRAIKDSAAATGTADDKCMVAALSGEDFSIELPENVDNKEISDHLYNRTLEIDECAIQAIKKHMPAAELPAFEAVADSSVIFTI